MRQPLRKNVLVRRQPAAEPLPSPAALLPPPQASSASAPQPVQPVKRAKQPPTRRLLTWSDKIQACVLLLVMAAWSYSGGDLWGGLLAIANVLCALIVLLM